MAKERKNNDWSKQRVVFKKADTVTNNSVPDTLVTSSNIAPTAPKAPSDTTFNFARKSERNVVDYDKQQKEIQSAWKSLREEKKNSYKDLFDSLGECAEGEEPANPTKIETGLGGEMEETISL